MPASPFDSSGGNRTGLATSMVAVTPSDSVDINGGDAVFIICKGAAGDVACVTASGDVVTYPISVNETLPVGVTRVNSTNTTATTLWAFIP